MKKIHFTFIRVLLAALVVAGLYTGYRVCSPTYPQAVANAPFYYDRAGKTDILKCPYRSYLAASVTSDSLLLFRRDAPAGAIPRVGSVIYVPISDAAPSGCMGVVTSVVSDSLVRVSVRFKPVGASIADSGDGLDAYIRHFRRSR